LQVEREKKPVEWQTDQFAANLLMPRELVKKAWQEWRGDMESIALADLGTCDGRF
jgi:Zn-dependent peptidase ImmA (M78 family)